MKKTLLLNAFSFLSLCCFAQVNLQSLVKPGTKLIYAVEANEQKYDFIVTVKAINPAVVFDWEMTNGTSNTGTITHTQTAMISANTMYNYFTPGQKTLDDNSISVWLSKNTFRGLGKGVMIKMNTGDVAKKMGTFTGTNELDILVDGEKETIEEEVAKELNNEGTAVGEDFFTFYSSFKLPIILRMRNGFYIALKEVRTK
jgi:hypothetical protein